MTDTYSNNYTEDTRLIASIQCDHNLMIEDIYIEELPEPRGFVFGGLAHK